jgi:hypothetical protein
LNVELSAVPALLLDGVQIQVIDDAVHFSGVIAMRDPATAITPYLSRIHRAVVESRAKELRVDITKLRFMNSSSIRSLVDWVDWILSEPEAKRYVLHFVTKPDVTWQGTTLSAIQSFGGAHVVVHRE